MIRSKAAKFHFHRHIISLAVILGAEKILNFSQTIYFQSFSRLIDPQNFNWSEKWLVLISIQNWLKLIALIQLIGLILINYLILTNQLDPN